MARTAKALALLLVLLIGAPAFATDICSADWSETDGSNNVAAPRGWPEGMAPSGVNDAGRAMMGATKRFWNRLDGVKTTAGTNTITVSYDVAAAAYCTGERFLLKAGGTNTGATTLNINSLGAKTVKTLGGQALIGGEIQTGKYFEVVYDGTDMLLLSEVRSTGTFTPTITTGSGSVTYTTQIGAWERKGNLVFFIIDITVNTVSTPSGTVSIGTLPFTAQNTSGQTTPVTLRQSGLNVTALTNPFLIQASITANTTAVTVEAIDTAGASLNVGSTIGAGDTIQLSGWYRTVD